MGKKCKPLKQTSGTWRLILDMTESQALRFRVAMGNKVDMESLLAMLEKSRYLYIASDKPFEEMKIQIDAKESPDK